MLVAVGEKLNPRAFNDGTAAFTWAIDPLSAMLEAPALPEGCQSRRRMEEVMGLRPDKCVNLLSPWEEWSQKIARRRASILLTWARAGHHRLALLGSRVSHAFGVSCVNQWSVEGVDVLSLPHPSGRSRALNCEDTRRWVRHLVVFFTRCVQ